MVVWVFQHCLFVGVRDVQAGFEEQWSGMGGPCMMAYIQIGLDVGYEWGLSMHYFSGAGCREGDLD